MGRWLNETKRNSEDSLCPESHRIRLLRAVGQALSAFSAHFQNNFVLTKTSVTEQSALFYESCCLDFKQTHRFSQTLQTLFRSFFGIMK